MLKLRLATRGSPLALLQTELVASLLRDALPGITIEPLIVRTKGDISTEPLDRIGGQGIFVSEVQQAVRDGFADIGIHSAKDLTSNKTHGLIIGATPQRADHRDALVGSTLDGLPVGGVVATGSPRRRAQLANLRPDLSFVELRGNMRTRVDMASAKRVDAVVVATAALQRLGWTTSITEILEPILMLPQAGQGIIAIECREDDGEVQEVLKLVDDPLTHRLLDAERAVLAALGGSCSVPVGAWAQSVGELDLELHALVASGDGRIVIRATKIGSDPDRLGVELAHYLLADCGGSRIEGFERGYGTHSSSADDSKKLGSLDGFIGDQRS